MLVLDLWPGGCAQLVVSWAADPESLSRAANPVCRLCTAGVCLNFLNPQASVFLEPDEGSIHEFNWKQGSTDHPSGHEGVTLTKGVGLCPFAVAHQRTSERVRVGLCVLATK